MVRNTYIYPPEPSMRIVADIIELHGRSTCRSSTRSRSPATTCRRPGRRPCRSSPSRSPTASSTCAAALGRRPRRRRLRRAPLVLLRHRHELLHGGRQAAGRPPAVAPGHGAVRARRSPSRSMLRTHCQTSGVSLTEQDPYNNIVRTADRGAGRGARRHAEPAHQLLRRGARRCPPTSRPASPATPSSSSPRRPASPTSSTRSAAATTSRRSPHALADEAWALIEEVEELGGMTKAVESGMPKLRIEEAAARRQARVDRGEEVDRRRQQVPARATPSTSTCATSTTPRCARQQIARLERVRAERDDAACQAALDALDRGRRAATATCSRCAIEAARARATRRRDLRRHGGGVRPPPGRDPYASPACTARPTRATRTSRESRREVDAFAEARGPPAAHARGRRWARTATTAAPR